MLYIQLLIRLFKDKNIDGEYISLICTETNDDITHNLKRVWNLDVGRKKMSSQNQLFYAIYDQSFEFEKEVYTEYLLEKAHVNKHSFIKRLLNSEARKSHKKAISIINEKKKQIEKVADAICLGGVASVDMASTEQRKIAIPILEEVIKIEPRYEKLRNTLKKLRAW